MNNLEPGAGGPASPPELTPNPLTIKPRPRAQTEMMKHYSGHQDAAAERYSKMREAKAQIDAVMNVFGRLSQLGDTVSTKDVIKGCGDIVAAGVPAVQMATILADMPEKAPELQAWVSDEFKKAQSAEKQIDEGLNVTRHGLISSALYNLVAHSAESQALANAAPAGRA